MRKAAEMSVDRPASLHWRHDLTLTGGAWRNKDEERDR